MKLFFCYRFMNMSQYHCIATHAVIIFNKAWNYVHHISWHQHLKLFNGTSWNYQRFHRRGGSLCFQLKRVFRREIFSWEYEKVASQARWVLTCHIYFYAKFYHRWSCFCLEHKCSFLWMMFEAQTGKVACMKLARKLLTSSSSRFLGNSSKRLLKLNDEQFFWSCERNFNEILFNVHIFWIEHHQKWRDKITFYIVNVQRPTSLLMH